MEKNVKLTGVRARKVSLEGRNDDNRCKQVEKSSEKQYYLIAHLRTIIGSS